MSPRASSAPLFLGLLAGFCLGVAVAWDRNTPPSRKTAEEWRSRPDTSGHAPAPVKLSSRADGLPSPAGSAGYGYENPVIRRKLDEFTRQTADRLAHTSEAEYAALYAKLGIPASAYREIVEHAKQVNRAKIKGSLALGEFLQVQADYQQHVQRLVGDKFPEYLAYEMDTPLRSELSDLLHFAEENKLTIKDTDRRALEGLLHELGPRVKAWAELGGPYQGMPKVCVGPDVLPVLVAEQEDFQRRLSLLDAQALQREISEQALFAIQAYYQRQVKLSGDLVARARDPGAFRRQMLADELVTLQASTDPNLKEIKRVQMLLQTTEPAKLR